PVREPAPARRLLPARLPAPATGDAGVGAGSYEEERIDLSRAAARSSEARRAPEDQHHLGQGSRRNLEDPAARSERAAEDHQPARRPRSAHASRPARTRARVRCAESTNSARTAARSAGTTTAAECE